MPPRPGENPAQAPTRPPEAAPAQVPVAETAEAKAAREAKEAEEEAAKKKAATEKAASNKRDEDEAEQALHAIAPVPYTAQEIDAVFKKPEYKTVLDNFYENDKDRQSLLAAITNGDDKAKIEWAINSPPTDEEKKALAERLKEKLPKNAVEITEAFDKGTLNYREGKVCEAMLQDAEDAKSKVTAAAEGLGFGVVLEKLIENLSKLFEKLGGMVERFAKSFEKTAFKLTSPLGGENKIVVLQKYEKDKSPLTIDAKTNTEIYGTVSGTVSKVEGNTVEITTPSKIKILYENVTPGVQQDAAIEAGKTKIGKSVSDAGVAIRLFDTQDQEHDPTKYLESYIQKPEQPK